MNRYVVLCGFTGEIVAQAHGTGVVTVEFRPDLHRWVSVGSGKLESSEPPPVRAIAEHFGAYRMSGEPLPTNNGLYVGRRLAVLDVTAEPRRVRVTVRRLEPGA